MAVKLPRMEVVHQHLSLLTSEVFLVCHIRSDAQQKLLLTRLYNKATSLITGERSTEPEVDSGRTSPI